jgi:hypothetical protein
MNIYVIIYNGLGDEHYPVMAFQSEEEAWAWVGSSPSGRSSEIHSFDVEEIWLEC